MIPVPLHLSDADIVFYPAFLNQQDSNRLLDQLIQTIDWRQDQITIYGRSLLQPRLTAWHGDFGKSYTYSGLTMNPKPWTPTLLDLKRKVQAISDVGFNSVLLNLYRDGSDSMGWQGRDADIFLKNTLSRGCAAFHAIQDNHIRPGLERQFEIIFDPGGS